MQTMRSTWLFTVLLALAGAHLVAAAPPPGKEAKARAVLYQTETSFVLQAEHWRITTNAVGRLVATHPLGPRQPGYDPIGYASLVVTFQPKSGTDTECGINYVGYLYGKNNGGEFNKSFTGPFPLNNPDAVKEINDLLATARKRMLATHPEYGATPVR